MDEIRSEALTQLGYYGFKPVTEEDLTPGREIYQFDLLREKVNRGTSPTIWGEKVLLDPTPVRDGTVLFHRDWDPSFQCFVPAKDFLDPYKSYNCGPYEFAYLIRTA